MSAEAGGHRGGWSALIRTFNCETTLPATLDCLRRQTRSAAEYVIVDSGSTDTTLALVPAGAVVRRYEGREFNYSAALNQGIDQVSAEYTLIISAHTTLADVRALEFALDLLDSRPDLAAAYFAGPLADERRVEFVDRHNFTGFNGLWNTCALVRTALLRQRPFRAEVFSAEDQEWASRLFRETDLSIACVLGCGMKVGNPRKASTRKRLNEYVAVAYFAKRELLSPRNVLHLLRRAILPAGGPRTADERWLDARMAFGLVRCWFVTPSAKSKYF